VTAIRSCFTKSLPYDRAPLSEPCNKTLRRCFEALWGEPCAWSSCLQHRIESRIFRLGAEIWNTHPAASICDENKVICKATFELILQKANAPDFWFNTESVPRDSASSASSSSPIYASEWRFPARVVTYSTLSLFLMKEFQMSVVLTRMHTE
jgi:hypothetical protein